MSSQSYSEVLRSDYQAINREQREAVASEVFNLDTLVQFKGLVGDISGGIIPIIGTIRMRIRVFSYLRLFTKRKN